MLRRAGIFASALLLATGCRTVRRACEGAVGEPFVEVEAALDRTGAKHTFGLPSAAPGQHRWTKLDTLGLGASLCYVDVDASGRVSAARYHEGN